MKGKYVMAIIATLLVAGMAWTSLSPDQDSAFPDS